MVAVGFMLSIGVSKFTTDSDKSIDSDKSRPVVSYDVL